MAKETLPHLARSDDPMDPKGFQFHFDGPVPRVGEVIDAGPAHYLVTAVRWQTTAVGPVPTKADPSENRRLHATLTCRLLKGYESEHELGRDAHLSPTWWKPFIK